MANHFDEAPCIYFSLADDGTILEVNRLLCNSLGYSKEELVGQKGDIIFTLPTRIFQQTHFFPLLKMQGHAEEIFITLRKRDGEYLPVLLNAERKAFAEGAASLHVGIIVYNRQKFEEELIAARKAAETALNENTALMQAKQELQKHTEALDQKINIVNKQNEELRQFNRVVTHNIQEPLRKLSVFSGMLLSQENNPGQQALVQKIRSAMTQMSSIVSGLQQYVWLNETPLHPVQVQLQQLLAAIKKKLEAEHPGVDLVLETGDLPHFEGDEAQVELLFYQLLSNAIRFRKDAEKAFVSVSASTLRQNSFRNVESRYKYVDYIRILVQDSGIGFNAEYKDQAFELFKRLHKDSGRGVGLSLCRKVVDNHQGLISIDSKMGESTVVTILLPLHRAGAAPQSNGGVEADGHI